MGVVSNSDFHPITEPHSHPFYEIILTVRGNGNVAVGDTELLMKDGSILVIPPNVIHGGCSNGGYEEIYIQDDSFPVIAEELKNDIIYMENDGDPFVITLARNLLYRFVRGKKDTTFSLLYELFLRLLVEKRASLKTDPAVEEVCSLLAQSYHDPELSLSAVLSATGYQKDYIRRRFVATCGFTPGEYLTNLRIEHAKMLLERRQEMGLSIAEIANRCGYYDSHYFSKVFKKNVGMTPAHFIQKGRIG